MTRWMWIAGLVLCCVAGMAFADEGEETVAKPTVVMTTSLGEIVIELDAEKAPITVENFLQYVDEEHYDGTIFHRVIRNFMIQGGGFDANMVQKPNRDPIKNEADNGLTNETGTVAMARTNEVDSADWNLMPLTLQSALPTSSLMPMMAFMKTRFSIVSSMVS